MKFRRHITVLVIIISVASFIATLAGIYSNDGEGPYLYETIRGEVVEIYGAGLYRHMSSSDAILGIAQDYVTLFAGIPLLLLGLFLYRKGNSNGGLLLTGVTLYFFLTYLFYTVLAMYNEMFLVYVLLLSCSLFALILNLLSFDYASPLIKSNTVVKVAGWFLLVVVVFMAMSWLQIILPPLFNRSIYPAELQHYTTLVVQGLDLGIFLPVGFVSAILALRGNTYGILFTTVYLIFLPLLMAALTSKMIFMANTGANVIPVIFIMPTIGIFSGIISFRLLKQVQ